MYWHGDGYVRKVLLGKISKMSVSGFEQLKVALFLLRIEGKVGSLSS